MDPELEGKLHELEVVSKLTEYLKCNIKIVFLDESLNFIYTLKWSKDKRNKYIDIFKTLISRVISKDAIPVGIFYTRAYDIMRSISLIENSEPHPVQDKHILNQYLKDGMRSQLFKVVNPVLKEYNLDILAFYLKVSDGNILRIEFPEEAIKKYDLDLVGNIHIAVLLHAILGNGYPYALIRAHEMAVLDYRDREYLESYISKILKVPPEYAYSRKAVSKWRSIA